MKAKRTKRLLHSRRKVQVAERTTYIGNDNHLHLNFASFDEVKKEGQKSALNKIRRKTIKTELEQYQHNNSKHIRLKPYYDAHIPVHWIGIVSDVTIPNKFDKLEGSILIDKIATEDHEELFDYHIWLNVTAIKMLVKKNNQKLSVGDYIEGISYVVPYESSGISKYGLGATVILNCGIFTGKVKAETLISNYERGDDWVLDMENSTAGQEARDKYEIGEFNPDSVEELAGHVSCTYQPSRYNKFQERLINDEKIVNAAPLPLVSKALQTYTAEVQSVFAKRIFQDDEITFEPTISLNKVINEHGRLISKSTIIPYPEQLAAIGLVPEDSKINFKAIGSQKHEQLFEIQVATIDDNIKDEMKMIPQDAEALAGYLLYIDNRPDNIQTKSGQKCLEKFFDWAKENDIIPSSLRTTDKAWDSTATYTGAELAQYLKFPVSWIDNLVWQDMLIPIDDQVNIEDMKFAGTEIDKLHEIQQANTEFLAKEVNRRYHFYRAKDIAEIVDLSVYQVAGMIVNTGYKSFNKYYGENVLKIIKNKVERKPIMQHSRTKDLLNRFGTNRSGVVVKREIPKDKSIKILQTTEPEEVATPTVAQKPTAEQATEVAVSKAGVGEEKTEPEKIETSEVEETAEVVQATEPAEVTPETDLEPEQVVEDKHDSNSRLVLITQSGKYYTTQFANEEKAEEFMCDSLLPGELNRFIKAQDVKTGKVRHISVRAILEWSME